MTISKNVFFCKKNANPESKKLKIVVFLSRHSSKFLSNNFKKKILAFSNFNFLLLDP